MNLQAIVLEYSVSSNLYLQVMKVFVTSGFLKIEINLNSVHQC
jgi:hypothetical protein